MLEIIFFFSGVSHLPSGCHCQPVHDLECAEDGEAREEAQGPADVGDDVHGGDGCGPDHPCCAVYVNVHIKNECTVGVVNRSFAERRGDEA